jgi:hypothetical protein
MITYAVIHNDTGNEQREGYSYEGSIIDRYDNLKDAQQAFKERNRWIWDKEYAFSMGMLHNGTFDRIVMLDGDTVKATDFDYE